MRGTFRFATIAVALLASPAARADESFKVEPLKGATPAELAPAIRDELGADGLRVVDGEGKPFAEIWVRKAVPASGKPAGAQGAIQFPTLAEGELIGVLRFVGEGHDYRDQTIAPGVYTLRYGLQPVNGDHLGVSPFRDYVLLSPAAKDASAAAPKRAALEDQSAEAAGTSHPAVLLLMTAPEGGQGIVRDEAKNTWGAVLPLKLAVKGEAAPAPLPVRLIVSGAAME